jgi:hypothetical protein
MFLPIIWGSAAIFLTGPGFPALPAAPEPAAGCRCGGMPLPCRGRSPLFSHLRRGAVFSVCPRMSPRVSSLAWGCIPVPFLKGESGERIRSLIALRGQPLMPKTACCRWSPPSPSQAASHGPVSFLRCGAVFVGKAGSGRRPFRGAFLARSFSQGAQAPLHARFCGPMTARLPLPNGPFGAMTTSELFSATHAARPPRRKAPPTEPPPPFRPSGEARSY